MLLKNFQIGNYALPKNKNDTYSRKSRIRDILQRLLCFNFNRNFIKMGSRLLMLLYFRCIVSNDTNREQLYLKKLCLQ